MLALIFAAGVLHGLGADHLAAITAVAGAGGGFQRITALAARFALGHALVIVLAGAAAFFGRGFLPPLWEKSFELLAGALLVVGGVFLLVGVLSKRISAHSHSHDHQGAQHGHFHFHFGRAAEHHHVHGILTVLLGALFALGGARSMLTAAPIALSHDGYEFFLRIAAFTAGIVISMTLFGALARLLLNRGNRSMVADPLTRMRRLSFLTACLCIATGVWTILSRVQS